ncbi:MAG: hypothetical protein II930_07770 [Lachnospiraceae bacterium]|nr:hypothetical protein [Lachnospiraceae bacterium]
MRKKVYDGTLIQALDPVIFLQPFIMPKRCDSQVLTEMEMDLGRAEAFIREHKNEIPGLTLYHLVFAALTRAAFEYPQINRFIVKGGVYQRDHVKISMMVKKEISISGEESSIFPCFESSDTLADMVRKCAEKTEEAFSEDQDDSAFDGLLKVLNALPGFITEAFARFMFWLDSRGRLPKPLVDIQPFHSSFFVTNVGSIGLPVIYHHLYEFGTVSGFLAFGQKEWKLYMTKDGTVRRKKVLPVTFLGDSRICDGYSYSCAFRTMKRCFEHPEVLLQSYDEQVKEKEKEKA